MSFLSFAVVTALVSVSQAANVWVSPTGSDSNPGTPQQPVQSLSRAYQLISPAAAFNNIFMAAATFTLTQKNSVTLGFANVNFISTGTQTELSCGGAAGPWFSFTQSQPSNYLWHTVSFQNVLFTNCDEYTLNMVVSFYNRNQGGMHFVFSDVEFTAPAIIAGQGNANYQPVNVTVNTGTFGAQGGSQLVGGLQVSNALTVAVSESSFTGCTYALSLSGVNTVALNDIQIMNCQSEDDSNVVTFSGVNQVWWTSSTVESNTAGEYSSVVELSNCGSANITDVQFGSNIAPYSVFFAYSNPGAGKSNVVFYDVGFQSNKGSSIVTLFGPATSQWSNVQVLNNTGVSTTVQLQNMQLTLTDSQLDGNTCSNGGALFLMGGSVVSSTYSSFSNNVAQSQGGAFYVTTSTLSLNDVTVANNQAQTAGAGYCTSSSTFSDPNTSFENNVSLDGSNPLQCS